VLALLDKVRKTIKENSLLNMGDSVICAVSGGADSICLLHTMLVLKSEYNLSLYVANVNHLIRGKESDLDSEFVKKVCRAADIECFYREYDVVKIARERKMGEEECGRILRYEFFDELSKKLGNAKIATAHNLNDNAETVVFRLARGTSAQGLCGIKYKRDNIIRPLLDISREEIEKYLRSNSLSWREDSTNQIPIYARNKIRLNVMPLLCEISSGAEQKIVSAARCIAEDNEFLNECERVVQSECFFGEYVLIKPFNDAPLPLKRRLAANVLQEWGVREVTAEKIEKFIDFFHKDSGKQFDIDSQCYAEKAYDKVNFCQRQNDDEFSDLLDIGHEVSQKNWTLSVEYSDNKLYKCGRNLAVFDAQKLILPFVVRYRKDGDKISPKGMYGTKKLSDVFSDEKIDRHLRDLIPIVEKDSNIIYIGGLRQSSLYATDEYTKKVIVIKYIKK